MANETERVLMAAIVADLVARLADYFTLAQVVDFTVIREELVRLEEKDLGCEGCRARARLRVDLVETVFSECKGFAENSKKHTCRPT